jgi:hypothetical protein
MSSKSPRTTGEAAYNSGRRWVPRPSAGVKKSDLARLAHTSRCAFSGVSRAFAGLKVCASRFFHTFTAPEILLVVVYLSVLPQTSLNAQQGNEQVRDASGEYHFLTADDTVGLLEEEGKIKGYVEVYQGEEESDTVLSYPITIGSREKNHVDFKTAKIHQKYYRFSGTVERGKGREEGDPDYLRLVGDLEIITVKADTGQESVERRHVIFPSKGKPEREQ